MNIIVRTADVYGMLQGIGNQEGNAGQMKSEFRSSDVRPLAGVPLTTASCIDADNSVEPPVPISMSVPVAPPPGLDSPRHSTVAPPPVASQAQVNSDAQTSASNEYVPPVAPNSAWHH